MREREKEREREKMRESERMREREKESYNRAIRRLQLSNTHLVQLMWLLLLSLRIQSQLSVELT